MNSVRSVPYNNEAENYILGSVFLDNNIMDALQGKLLASDFYDPRNQKIFAAMSNLRNKRVKIEVISLLEELQHQKVSVDEELKTYILDMIDSVPSTATSDIYISLVEEKSLERKLLQNMQDISDDILMSRLDFNAILDKTEDKMLGVIQKRRTTDFIKIDQAARETLEKLESIQTLDSNVTGLDTGFPKLNKATLGFQPGNLIILAARPAVGKSSYALNLALNVCKFNDGARVAIFSLEMSITQILTRLFACDAGISMNRLQSGKLDSLSIQALALAKEKLSKLDIYFDESSSTNIGDIRTKCRQLKQTSGLDFIVIDYLQLVTTVSSNGRSGNRQEEVSQISRQLKTLARELNVPVLALSQLSRSIEGRENKEPQLADLRESGSIEQDADVVMFLYRRSDVEDKEDTGSEELATADALNEKVKEASGLQTVNNEDEHIKSLEIILNIAKNRQGPTDHMDYNFYGAYSRFRECEITREVIHKKNKQQGFTRLKNLNKEN
jgi:replicative DNA helicase